MLNDKVLRIDGIEMLDFIDDTYSNTLQDPTIFIERDGQNMELKLKKNADEGIGLIYSENLYPDEDECVNGCVFCFVDQLPKGMRKSLYVKDDDWRYSVLYGNYITMTNMSENDFNRIATRKVSPLYISVHSTDPEVRFKLLRNKRARLINDQLKFLYENEITFHSQIVMCPGINDGPDLDKTIMEMAELYSFAKTLSVVPVGLTAHRANLPELRQVDQSTARDTISRVDAFREKFAKKLGEPFVYVSDEFYSKAGLDYPRYSPGEINAQKANGVGLFSDFLDEIDCALEEDEEQTSAARSVILVTGVSAYGEILKIAGRLADKYKNLDITVIKAHNIRFGQSITVAGLLTGYDIIEAVGGKKADAVFIPESSLRDGVNVFLDDKTVQDVEKAIGSKVIISPNDGYEFVKILTGGKF